MNSQPRLLALLIAAAAACTSVGCAVTSGQSSVGEYVDDATITTRVKARLAQDPVASAMRTQVETQNGVVQLSGFAASEAERAQAAELARTVPHVKGVRNDIIVRPPSN
ncbi:BON domain-containing protein [Caldimonas thermodepolymerans]|jgi:Predicted periplasmic or secreted lipoprotein|uniref:BON domain-containing protein n=1 Tax=Caldimonas thermodepolymerans TaxID=215580 RepID=UPI002235CAC7|nr:BON domain-containing protein [Caldimonas thermodepolymerans]UZG45483.1 BON domain-containing protein [Caldimonas thermodepolymerans]